MFTAAQIKTMIEAGDVSAFYNDFYWRKLSHEIIKAGHNECTMCKQHGRYSPAVLTHHITPLKQAPERAYDRSNLIALCHECHETIHERGAFANVNGYQNIEKW